MSAPVVSSCFHDEFTGQAMGFKLGNLYACTILQHRDLYLLGVTNSNHFMPTPEEFARRIVHPPEKYTSYIGNPKTRDKILESNHPLPRSINNYHVGSRQHYALL